MAPKARLFTHTLLQIRGMHRIHRTPQQVFIRENHQFSWSRATLSYGIPLIAAFGYLHWSSSDDQVKVGRIEVDKLEKGEGKDDTVSSRRLFIRCTAPQRVFRDTQDELSDSEKEKLKTTMETIQIKEEKDRIYGDLLGRVNDAVKRQNFYGAGLPNSVGIVLSETPRGVKYYYYEAKGLSISWNGIEWTTHTVSPRDATSVENILATPGMAFSALVETVRLQWSSSTLKPQVVSNDGQAGRQPATKPTADDQSLTGPSTQSSSSSEQGSVETMTTSSSPNALASASSPLSETPREKPKYFFSHGNHVDVVTSFLNLQKEAVRQSNGIYTSRARSFVNTFWKEFKYEQTLRMIHTYFPPGGNLVFEITVVINGPKRRVLLFVEGDYDVTNHTWGPIFIEPMKSMRSKGRSKNNRR